MKIRKENVKCILVSLFVLLAINSTESLVIGAESENALLNFVSKLAYAISTVNIVDIMTLIGIYALILYVIRQRASKVDIAGVVVAMIFAFLYMWCFSYKLMQDTSALFANTFQIFLTIIRFCGYTILFYAGFELFSMILEKAQIYKNDNGKKVFIISSLIVLCGWGFWIIMAYPGSVAGDGVTQLGQYYFGTISAHHPPLSTWIMGTLFEIGRSITGDARFGIFLYLVVQAICGALIIGYSIITMYEFGISKALCYLSAVFFGMTPVLGMFAQWYEKDLLYSLATLLFLTKMARMCLDKINIKGIIFLTVVGIICVFLRNNGIYAVIPAMILLIIVADNRSIRFILMGCSAFVIIFTLIINGPVFKAMNINSTNVKEALSIPMQQSARYITEYGDEVTKEERLILQLFFNDYENVPNIYEPSCADAIKDNVFIEKKDLPRYFLVWLKMGIKHPGVYFDAFMCLNYGYLAPTEQNAEATINMPNEEGGTIMTQLSTMGIDGTQDFNNIQTLNSLLFINMIFPVIRYLSMPGFYTWIMIAIIAISVKLRNKKLFILLVPNIINILVCFASPLCNGMRYELPVVLSIPLILAITIVLMKHNNNKEITVE